MRQGGREREKERERILYIKDPAKRDKLIERIMSTSLSIFKKEKKMKREKEREGKKEGEGKEKKRKVGHPKSTYHMVALNAIQTGKTKYEDRSQDSGSLWWCNWEKTR